MIKITLGKNMKRITILLATTVLLSCSANAECKPNWCDSKKLSETENIICADAMLRASDALLNSTYSALIIYSNEKDKIKKNQKHWMRERNKLDGKNEILGSYMNRINTLYNKFKTPIDTATTTPHQKIEKIYKAIVENKSKALADLMKFPTTITISGKENKFETKAKFLEKYSNIFTKAYRENIAKEKPSSDMFSNYQGIMLGDGIIWFTEDGNLQSLNK